MASPLQKCQRHERQRLKDNHKWKETKEIWQLNVIWDPGLDPGPGKHISGKTGRIQIKLIDLVNGIYQCSFPGFNKYTMVM